MRLLSPPTLGFAPFTGRLCYPAHSLTLIAKAVVSLVPGGVARLLAGDATMPSGDVAYPDGLGGPRYESDFVHFKSAADVLLVGHYHAPGQRPVQVDEVRVVVGPKSTRLSVVGKRRWAGVHRFPPAREAEPFTTLELRWEHAFGGPGFGPNPVGLGYVAAPREFAREPLSLPRLERPDRAYWNIDQPPEPLCFAPIARTWPGRQSLAGTYDASWQRTRWPWFASDCKPEYFSACAADLRVSGYLQGDEPLRLTNMHPEHPTYLTSLPGQRVVAAVQRTLPDGGHAFEALAMHLDTLWIDMDAEQAALVWRGTCRIADADASDIVYAWTDLEPIEAASTTAAIEARAAQGIADEEAQWEWSVPSRPREPDRPPAAEPPLDEPALPEDLAQALRAIPAAPEPVRPTLSVEEEAQLTAAREKAATELEMLWDEVGASEATWTRERVESARARGESLAGLDLSGADLRGVDLAGCNLERTLFVRARLDAANFSGANLTGAALERATLNGADFSEACLRDADLSNTHGIRITACKADLSGAILDGCQWPDVRFDGARLVLVVGKGAELPGASFIDADLSEAAFEDAQLPAAVFQRSKLRGSRWVRSALTGATFAGAELNEADFDGANLEEASFDRCALDDVSLEAAMFGRGKLTDCSVEKLRAAAADLTGSRWLRVSGDAAVLSGANLTRATLDSVQLPGVDACDARLQGAQLRGCSLRGGRFERADLSGAEVLGCDCFEASFEAARLLDCDGSESSFFQAEFLDALSATFFGRGRDLTRTKLASPSDRT